MVLWNVNSPKRHNSNDRTRAGILTYFFNKFSLYKKCILSITSTFNPYFSVKNWTALITSFKVLIQCTQKLTTFLKTELKYNKTHKIVWKATFLRKIILEFSLEILLTKKSPEIYRCQWGHWRDSSLYPCPLPRRRDKCSSKYICTFKTEESASRLMGRNPRNQKRSLCWDHGLDHEIQTGPY